MNSEESNTPILVSPRESRIRLRKAREAAGKIPYDLAQFVEHSVSWYWDLENCDWELQSNISIGQLSALCSDLGITPRDLFESKRGEVESKVLPEELSARIKAYLNTTGISVAEFSDRVGYAMEPSLRNHSEILNWNVDWLRSVCNEIGINWLNALP